MSKGKSAKSFLVARDSVPFAKIFVTKGSANKRVLEAKLPVGVANIGAAKVPKFEENVGGAEYIRYLSPKLEDDAPLAKWIRAKTPGVPEFDANVPFSLKEPDEAPFVVRSHRRNGFLVKKHLRRKKLSRAVWKGASYKRKDGSWRNANTGKVMTDSGRLKGYEFRKAHGYGGDTLPLKDALSRIRKTKAKPDKDFIRTKEPLARGAR